MKRTLTLGLATLAISASSLSAAQVGFLSNVVGPSPTEVNYTLTLSKFDPSLGTLTGVQLYFFGSENVSTFNVSNGSNAAVTSDLSADVNLVRNSTNTATAADRFIGQTLAIFDTGIGNARGACNGTPAGTPAPGTCSPITVAANSTNSYGPIVVNNTDATFGLATGTGTQGLNGVTKTGTVISNYSAVASTFNLTGSTFNTTGFAGTGGNFVLSQVATAKFRAEVDYTFTPNSPVPTPEPATMGLLGSALLGLGLLKFRTRKS